MNMITGYIEATSGEILVNGYDVLKRPNKAKACIGYMPENTPLYKELTVYEFVRYLAELKRVPKKEIKAQIEKLLKDTGIEEVRNKLIRNLSRGYKQRVSLCRSIDWKSGSNYIGRAYSRS